VSVNRHVNYGGCSCKCNYDTELSWGAVAAASPSVPLLVLPRIQHPKPAPTPTCPSDYVAPPPYWINPTKGFRVYSATPCWPAPDFPACGTLVCLRH
jgi:hypothetical protein